MVSLGRLMLSLFLDGAISCKAHSLYMKVSRRYHGGITEVSRRYHGGTMKVSRGYIPAVLYVAYSTQRRHYILTAWPEYAMMAIVPITGAMFASVEFKGGRS